jgi:hypothetical protein
MWDDPNRLPIELDPQYKRLLQLQAPEMEGGNE